MPSIRRNHHWGSQAPPAYIGHVVIPDAAARRPDCEGRDADANAVGGPKGEPQGCGE